MLILGIETSCDETAAAVVQDGKNILSNAIASSQDMHAKTGGIIPEKAAREQLRSIIPVIDQSLKDAKIDASEIDAIAVTVGPGLAGSLMVGVETAKTLSFLWNKPVIPVNHLVAHLYANWVEATPQFPAVGLVVSGGHTDLVLMKGHGKVKLIGQTRDDAAGEAFDKTARLLGLGYPGGPAMSMAAEKYLQDNESAKLNLFPRPMISSDDFDFSFSGLKTAVLNFTKKSEGFNVNEVAANVQEAIVESLVAKSIKAINKYLPKSFILAGGVAANERLRILFKERISKDCLGVDFFSPKPNLSTDNAVMIAACAFFNNNVRPWKTISVDPQMTIA